LIFWKIRGKWSEFVAHNFQEKLQMVEKKVFQQLSKLYTGAVHDCLDKLGIWGCIEGMNLYGHLPASGKICGLAKTVQFVPARKKVVSSNYHRAIDQVGNGGVLVIDTAGAKGSCTGELMCTGAKAHGAIATIVNGTVRDIPEIEDLTDYPVYAKGVLPVSAVGRMEDIAYNVDIEINGIRIQPGDIIFGDRDGVVVVPQQAAILVAELAAELAKMERDFKKEILEGKSMYDIFKNALA
jgi:4-hydroxy-4-methyl-2-oxoglutarate aldolase